MPQPATAVSFESNANVPEELYKAPRWYACYTRGRHEKRVEELFRRQGIESYLPVAPRVSQWKDRKKLVHFPLFPGYVFGCFPLSRLAQVLGTHGVAAVVGASGRPEPIPASAIEGVRRVSEAAAKAGIELERADLVHRGNWVRIESGPLQGVEGLVIERLGRRRVLVGIRAIGEGLEVDVPLDSLRPIAEPA